MTWPNECKEWKHLQGIDYLPATGTERARRKALSARPFILGVNYESLPWLLQQDLTGYEMIVFDEVMPMVNELNALLDHNEKQAEESRRHAGNLAHALKTPLTVIMNSATAKAPDLDETVIREATTMRRQVDHHLARARAGQVSPPPPPEQITPRHLPPEAGGLFHEVASRRYPFEMRYRAEDYLANLEAYRGSMPSVTQNRA